MKGSFSFFIFSREENLKSFVLIPVSSPLFEFSVWKSQITLRSNNEIKQMILPFNFLRVEIKVKLARHNDVIPIYPGSNHGSHITLDINRFNHASHDDCKPSLSFLRSTISCPLPPIHGRSGHPGEWNPVRQHCLQECWGNVHDNIWFKCQKRGIF